MPITRHHRTSKPRLRVIGQASAEDAYPIEKRVPLPPRGGNYEVYPFGLMQVGDSFAVRDNSPRALNRLRASAAAYGKRHGKKFTVRAMDHVSKKYRCWRTA